MSIVIKIGRLFFAIGIIVFGLQQIIIRDFRPQILPEFPSWAHNITLLPVATGLAMIIIGLILSGLFKVEDIHKKKLSLYFGIYLLVLIIVCHIPYLLFIYPHKLSHLGSWGNVLKTLAYTGGAFIMAYSFSKFINLNNKKQNRGFQITATLGRVFFCTTIILFGCTHFVYDLSSMVPKWLGNSVFWSYFGGAALIASGVAILFKIFLNPVGLLLGAMLFLWFMIVHIPNAIAYPYAGRGNQIVSAFDALLFCGIALLLSQLDVTKKNTKMIPFNST